jgi:hypothetical protein
MQVVRFDDFLSSSFVDKAICMYSLLRPQQGLDCAAFIHCAVGLCDLIEWQGQVEYLEKSIIQSSL